MLEDIVANLANHAETGQIPKPYRRGIHSIITYRILERNRWIFSHKMAARVVRSTKPSEQIALSSGGRMEDGAFG